MTGPLASLFFVSAGGGEGVCVCVCVKRGVVVVASRDACFPPPPHVYIHASVGAARLCVCMVINKIYNQTASVQKINTHQRLKFEHFLFG